MLDVEKPILLMEVDFIYDNWNKAEDFFKEFEQFKTVEEKRNYFIEKYGRKYKDRYNEYPKIVLKNSI